MLLPLLRTCSVCPLSAEARSVGVPTIHLPSSLPPLPSNPAIVFIGQNPGNAEDIAAEPFVSSGPSGRLVRNAFCLFHNFSTRASIYLTNAARCYTRPASPPRLSHYTRCSRTHLLPDLAHISSLHTPAATFLICLGSEAVRAVYRIAINLKSASLSHAFSHQNTSSPFGSIFATYHPAAYLRQTTLLPAIEAHLSLVAAALSGSFPSPSSPRCVPAGPPPCA